jgi:hypothetical protein
MSGHLHLSSLTTRSSSLTYTPSSLFMTTKYSADKTCCSDHRRISSNMWIDSSIAAFSSKPECCPFEFSTSPSWSQVRVRIPSPNSSRVRIPSPNSSSQSEYLPPVPAKSVRIPSPNFSQARVGIHPPAPAKSECIPSAVPVQYYAPTPARCYDASTVIARGYDLSQSPFTYPRLRVAPWCCGTTPSLHT